MARPACISVIVPCYNYGHFLGGCLDSILSQREVEVRVLVIDDCSPDGSGARAVALCDADPRVTLRRHAVNAGLIATANEGLEWADGDGVLLLSADDLLVPGALARAGAILAAHPRVGLVYGRPLLVHEGAPLPQRAGRWRATQVWGGPEWIRRRCASAHNAMSSPEVVVRTAVQHAVGGYDPVCHHTSDLHMWLRVAAVSDIAHVRGAAQAIYRVHGQSMQRTQASPLVDLRDRHLAFERFFSASGASLPGAAEMARSARRALARQALWTASRTVDRGAPAQQALVAELSAFACEVYPQARALREWRGLAVRRALGPGRSRAFAPFAITGAAHKLAYHAGRARWRVQGV